MKGKNGGPGTGWAGGDGSGPGCVPALPCGAGAGPAHVSSVMSQCQVSLEGTGGPGESKGLASLGFQALVFSFPGKMARFH